MINIEKFVLYLVLFSLSLEAWDPFSFGIDYFTIKVTLTFYFFFTFLNMGKYFAVKEHIFKIFSVGAIFLILTIANLKMSYVDFDARVFDTPLFLNILLLLSLLNFSRLDYEILWKALFSFYLGCVFLVILNIFNVVEVTTLNDRFSILGYNSNELGLNLSVALLIHLGLIFRTTSWISYTLKIILIIPSFFIALLMIQTASRVAFFVLVLGIVCLFLFNKNKKSPFSLVVFICIFLSGYFYLKDSYVFERVLQSINDGDTAGRDYIWSILLDMSDHIPFWGIGKIGYDSFTADIFGNRSSPHNVFIEIYFYTGLMGLSFFLWFLFDLLKKAFIDYTEKREIFSIVLLFPIIGVVLTGQLLGPKLAWVLIAFIFSAKRNPKVLY